MARVAGLTPTPATVALRTRMGCSFLGAGGPKPRLFPYGELARPVEVVAPRVRNRTRADPDHDRRDPVGLGRVREQVHARLLRRATTLAAVALVAAGHDVGPLGP